MYAWGPVIRSLREGKSAAASEELRVKEELRVAVTFLRPDGGHGPTKSDVPLSLENVKDFVPKKEIMNDGIDELTRLGFELTGKGELTASMKCTKDLFEKVFNITLEKVDLDINENYAFHSFYFPPKGLPWTPILDRLIDDVYIQWPIIYASPVPSATPPKLRDFYLEPPKHIASYLNAHEVHEKKMFGENICLVMIDTGFEHESHRFFSDNKYTSKVVLAGNAVGKKKDLFGHGTGQSANVFSIAPRVKFIGVKIETNDISDFMTINRAALLEGFYTARQQEPDIILISGGANLKDQESGNQLLKLPRNLKALEAEILHAVASGITVVAAAGNGNFLFPGMMPDVISVGGVYVEGNNMQASNIASAYDSKIYHRHVPDICGLVGRDVEGVSDRYIILPIPPGCLMDIKTVRAGTKDDDGLAFFSGTSAAAAQIAGVCALLKGKKRNLKPWEIKQILMRTAQKVALGNSNPKSSENGIPLKAVDGASGAGLVDAFRAWQEIE